MASKFSLFITIAVIFIADTNCIGNYFEVLIDRFDLLYNGTSFADFSGIKVRKVNKTRCLVGEVIVNEPLGNDLLVNIKFYKKQGGEYRLMPYELKEKPFCDFYGSDIYIYPDFAKGSDFPLDLKEICPLKPGKYVLHNISFSFENVPKAAAPSGDYAAEMIYFKKGIMANKYRIYASINNFV